MKFEKLLEHVISILSGTLLVLMVALVFMQIVFREFFSISFSWTDEIAQFCMMWMVLTVSILITKDGQHISTGFAMHAKLNQSLVHLIDSVLALVIVISAAIVAYQSAMYALLQMDTASLSLMWIKMGCVFISLPIFMFAVDYFYLKSFFKHFFLIFNKK
jgi:TRAP-type C4-dicarboxylate transport system permease small subunit